MRARPWYAFAAVAAAMTAVPLAGPAAHAAPDAATDFTFTDERIDSSAGLAVLPTESNYAFTINDHAPTRVFGVDRKTGHSAVTMRLQNAKTVDWQAIAPGRNRTLWIGDIGGGGGSRRSVTVYKFELPTWLHTGYFPSTAYRLRYPDGPHDAQALLVNPTDGTMYVATDDSGGGNLYAANDLTTGGTQLRKVGSVPGNVTDGAYRPDGKQFVLRTPGKAYVYSAPGKQAGTMALPKQRQGKGIAYTSNGKALLLSGGGANTKVLRVKVSATLGTSSSSPKPSATPSNTSGSSVGGDGNGLANLAFIIGPFVIAAIAVLVALLVRKRTPVYEGGRGGGAGSHAFRRYERDEPYPPPAFTERAAPRSPPAQPYEPPPEQRYRDAPFPGQDGRRAEEPRRRAAGRPRLGRRGKRGDDSVPFWLQD